MPMKHNWVVEENNLIKENLGEEKIDNYVR